MITANRHSEQQLAVDFATWDGAAALQQLSVPPMITPSEGINNQNSAGFTSSLDSIMFTADYQEDTTFLMGLTGFDMMGFGFQD